MPLSQKKKKRKTNQVFRFFLCVCVYEVLYTTRGFSIRIWFIEGDFEKISNLFWLSG